MVALSFEELDEGQKNRALAYLLSMLAMKTKPNALRSRRSLELFDHIGLANAALEHDKHTGEAQNPESFKYIGTRHSSSYFSPALQAARQELSVAPDPQDGLDHLLRICNICDDILQLAKGFEAGNSDPGELAKKVVDLSIALLQIPDYKMGPQPKRSDKRDNAPYPVYIQEEIRVLQNTCGEAITRCVDAAHPPDDRKLLVIKTKALAQLPDLVRLDSEAKPRRPKEVSATANRIRTHVDIRTGQESEHSSGQKKLRGKDRPVVRGAQGGFVRVVAPKPKKRK